MTRKLGFGRVVMFAWLMALPTVAGAQSAESEIRLAP